MFPFNIQVIYTHFQQNSFKLSGDVTANFEVMFNVNDIILMICDGKITLNDSVYGKCLTASDPSVLFDWNCLIQSSSAFSDNTILNIQIIKRKKKS